MDRQDLLEGSKRDWARLLRCGFAINRSDIAGFAYRGVSLGLPKLVERLTWKTFQKVFWRDDAEQVRGWNVRLEQRGLLAPSVPKRRRGKAVTFGHFAVEELSKFAVPQDTPQGLMLDYGAYHPWFHPMRRLRDPLVAVNVDNAELLLGWSYLALGSRGLGTPSYFLLERESVVNEAPALPGPRT